ncbi:hypothetical protein BH09ACT4_BH09ACT4_00520 [soil metagenome]
MTDPIPLIADVPTSEPGLGFTDYSRALADAIRGGKPARFTLGLYGAWGSGKSSLLAAIARDLKKDEDILVVEFDAWRYERTEHIVIPLLHAVAKTATKRKPFRKVAEQLGHVLVSMVKGITLSAKIFDIGLEFSGNDAVGEYQAPTTTPLDEAFSRPIDELKRIPDTLGSGRIVVLVDDLDRCSPDRVVGMLEAINLVMDVSGFIFVLALDYEVLVEAVQARYKFTDPKSSHAFIEKMVQLPFRVPPLQIGDEVALRAIVPDWTGFVSGHSEIVDQLVGVSTLALSGNPRQVKRLVNHVLLLERIVIRRELDVPSSALVSMVALQLAWPETYRDLVARVSREDPAPLALVYESPIDELRKFADAHMDEFESMSLLKATLSLTFAVESSAAPSGVKGPRTIFEGWLRTQGFEPIPDPVDPDRTRWRPVWQGAVMVVTTREEVEIHDLQADGTTTPALTMVYQAHDLTTAIRTRMTRPTP